jgi:hypothetical protein
VRERWKAANRVDPLIGGYDPATLPKLVAIQQESCEESGEFLVRVQR